jgi:hypothetical protein
MNNPSFSSGVAPLKYDDNFSSASLHPLLHVDELRLKFAQLALVLFAGKILPPCRGIALALLSRHRRVASDDSRVSDLKEP